MRWREGYIAVDWGTTNRRAWRIGADGRVADEIDDDQGVLAVPLVPPNRTSWPGPAQSERPKHDASATGNPEVV